LVRLPIHVFEKIVRISRYRKENPGAGTHELIQIATDDGYKYSQKEIAALLRYSEQYLNITSLNTLVGDNEDSELVDFIPDDKGISLEDEVSLLFLSDDIIAVLSKLKPKETKVLLLRYGFGCNPHTLEEVGTIFKVTRERIRQIEAKALRKIRELHAKRLIDYI